MHLEQRQGSSELLSRPSRPLNENGAKVVAVAAVFMASSTIVVALRFYARYLKRISYGLEDWCALASLIMFYGYASSVILVVCTGGIGYHAVELGVPQLRTGLKITLAIQILYGIGIVFVKCSICLMLVRIFFVKAFRIAAYLVMTFCVLWGLVIVLVACLICRPLKYSWNPLPTTKHCGNQRSADAAVGIIGIFTDVAILVLPLSMIWSLQLPTARKASLTAILCLGVFTIAMSIARVVTLFRTDFNDFTYSIYNNCWPLLEYGIAILVCCAPLLKPLVEKTPFPPSSSSRTKTQSSTNDTTFSKQGHSGFSQLSEGEIPLRSMAAPTSITSIAGIAPQYKHQMSSSVGRVPGAESHGFYRPEEHIKVERSWDVGARHV